LNAISSNWLCAAVRRRTAGFKCLAAAAPVANKQAIAMKPT